MRLSILMATAALAIGGCGSDDDTKRAAPTKPAAAGSKPERVRIEVGSGPGYATFAYGRVWVGNHGDDTVVAIDPATNEIAQTVMVPGEPTGISAGFGSIWTFTPVGGGRIRRIDPKAGKVVASIRVASPGGPLGGLVRAAGSMWFAGEDDWLLRIDPRSNRAKRVLRLPEALVPCAGQLTAFGKDLWMARECGDERLLRIDPRRGRIAGTIRVRDDFPIWTTTDGRRLWALTQGGKVLEIDRGSIARRAQIADTGSGIVHGERALWVRAGADKLIRVDPQTLKPTRSDALAAAPVPGGAVAVGGGAVWAGNFAEGTVYRLRP
jgi:YVTN family beta-propeller protein